MASVPGSFVLKKTQKTGGKCEHRFRYYDNYINNSGRSRDKLGTNLYCVIKYIQHLVVAWKKMSHKYQIEIY